MSILVACPECARKLKIADKLAGKRLRCPACQKPFQVPEPLPDDLPARKPPIAARPHNRSQHDGDAAANSVPPQPNRSAPQSRRRVWVLAGVATLVVAGVVAAVVIRSGKQQAPVERPRDPVDSETSGSPVVAGYENNNAEAASGIHQELVLDLPAAPDKGRIALAGPTSFKRNDFSTFPIAYVADAEWHGKTVFVSVTQTLVVDQTVQDRRTLSMGTRGGTQKVSSFAELIVAPQGRMNITLPPCKYSEVDSSVNVIADRSFRSTIELVIMTDRDKGRSISNEVRTALTDGNQGSRQSPRPEGTSRSDDLDITNVTLVSEKDGAYKMSITLKDPLTDDVLSDSTIRLLFISPDAKKKIQSATDIQFAGGRFTAAVPYSWAQGLIDDGVATNAGYIVDVSINKAKWPTSSPRTIELSLQFGDPRFVWSNELASWIRFTKKGLFHVAFVKYAKDGNTKVLASNSFKGEFDLNSSEKTEPQKEPEPKADQPDKTSIFNVIKLLKDLGFEVGDRNTTNFKTNVGSWTVHRYSCVNKKTSVELKLYRNGGLLDLPGSRWALAASEPKAKEALLALAARISPELRKACDECLKEYAQSKKPVSQAVGEKPRQLKVGATDKLIIETDPPPSPFY